MRNSLIGLSAALLSLAVIQGIALADFNAGDFARNFNSFNYGGNTYTPGFIMRGAGPVLKVTDVSANGFNLDINAYSSSLAGQVDPMRAGYDVGAFTTRMGSSGFFYGDDLYFSSFALTSTPATLTEYVGKLSYDGGATRATNGKAINLGIAYLYTKYATGALSNYDYANNSTAAELQSALQLLLNGGITSEQWATNRFLGHLVGETGNAGIWTTQYDLNNTSYPWLDGTYAVYVMNLNGSGSQGDVLYLVKRGGGSSDVPEPATLISWTVLGLGLFGAARRRRKHDRIMG